MAINHKAEAMSRAATTPTRTSDPKLARTHALLYVGDQVARVADALEAKPSQGQNGTAPPALADLAAGARAFFKAVTR